MSNQLNLKSLALEMFQTGLRADCVIEVVTQIDGQQQDPEKKVFFIFIFIGALALFSVLGYVPLDYVKNTKVSISK
jgi:hypothetical protein